MGRAPCCAKEGLNRGAWTVIEDKILSDYIQTHGEGRWRSIPKDAGLKRCGKSCRLRWLNYLKPDIKRGNISHEEEDLIIKLHRLLGNRWSMIAKRLPGRTDNEIKNYWNTYLRKKLLVKGKESNKVIDEPAAVCGVIRTKAFRCRGVFISTTAQPRAGGREGSNTTAAAAYTTEEEPSAAYNVNVNAATSLESEPMAEPIDIYWDHFFDDDQFWQACNLDSVLEDGGGSDVDANDPWPSSDQFLMLSDEMIKDWILDD